MQNRTWTALIIVTLTVGLVVGTEYGPSLKSPQTYNVWHGIEAIAFPGSEVFHEVGCTYALRSADGDLVMYETRGGAITDGRRPCKQCDRSVQ